jgi:hypothetical protein
MRTIVNLELSVLSTTTAGQITAGPWGGAVGLRVARSLDATLLPLGTGLEDDWYWFYGWESGRMDLASGSAARGGLPHVIKADIRSKRKINDFESPWLVWQRTPLAPTDMELSGWVHTLLALP